MRQVKLKTCFFKKHKPGQALLEFIFIIPLIMALVISIVALGVVLDYKQKLEGVAREATRLVSKSTGNGNIEIGMGRAEEVAQKYGLDPARLSIEVTGVSDSMTPARGGVVKAVVRYRVKAFIFPELTVVGQHQESIECWRMRDDDNSGGSCLPPVDETG
ncbi:MAG: pilus assembly protein [Chloroflexi bacterium]|uniref:Pilus assembly protein n=2 Tax=Candidatus Chlorohelix allophototropha TaxID=3003348 RepID=A0A8T7M4U0_9CHLR|nr:pilus assembly protein [Chloroflexota bacterium]